MIFCANGRLLFDFQTSFDISFKNLGRRQEQFEQSAAGRAAKAQLAAAAKQNANTNKGEPVLKVMQFSFYYSCI